MPSETLFESCRCGMMADKDGNVAIFHDYNTEIDVEWVEYRLGEMNLIDNEGQSLRLGIDLDKAIMDNISNGQQISLINVQNKEIQSSKTVPLIIQTV
jgi:hypothetical protein